MPDARLIQSMPDSEQYLCASYDKGDIVININIRGVKFSETFLKSFYRSKIVLHLELRHINIRHIKENKACF